MGEQVAARSYGGVAQLGEHLPCKQGVKSSNLSISIRSDHLIGITSKHNTLRNAGIPHDSVFDVALYLENRIWKIQKYQMVESKDFNHADRDIRGSYL